MNESKLTRKIITYLKSEGAFAVKIHGGPHQPAGLPDIVGCYRSIFFGLEVKVPGREHTLTERQAKKLRDITSAGGLAAMITSVAEAKEMLTGIDAMVQVVQVGERE